MHYIYYILGFGLCGKKLLRKASEGRESIPRTASQLPRAKEKTLQSSFSLSLSLLFLHFSSSATREGQKTLHKERPRVASVVPPPPPSKSHRALCIVYSGTVYYSVFNIPASVYLRFISFVIYAQRDILCVLIFPPPRRCAYMTLNIFCIISNKMRKVNKHIIEFYNQKKVCVYNIYINSKLIIIWLLPSHKVTLMRAAVIKYPSRPHT